jgi:hypothetical protein
MYAGREFVVAGGLMSYGNAICERKSKKLGDFCHHSYAIFAAMTRLMVLVIIAGPLLGSCSSGGAMGDYMPHWAGGLPKNAPPRPGTPEYDAYRQKLDAEAARDKSKDPPKAKTEGESLPQALGPVH